jgi:hypothetical protein
VSINTQLGVGAESSARDWAQIGINLVAAFALVGLGVVGIWAALVLMEAMV